MSEFDNALNALAEAQAAVEDYGSKLLEQYDVAREAFVADKSPENKVAYHAAAQALNDYRAFRRSAQGPQPGTVAPPPVEAGEAFKSEGLEGLGG